MALVASAAAEPPSSSYGLPSVQSGYNYQPQGYNYQPLQLVGTDYHQVNTGHQSNEGLRVDHNLLHKIEQILIQEENRNNRGGLSGISTGYGVPQSQYGPPSHWVQQSKVVGIDFGHNHQSHLVAQYLGNDRYASGHGTGQGWNKGNSGWQSGNSGWQSQNSGWQSGITTSYVVPSKPVVGWSEPSRPTGWVSPPSGRYGVPRY